MRIGSLFSGYGGLDMAVMRFFGGELSWYSEIDPAPSKIMQQHHPDVPNLGDVKVIDWSTVGPIDILTGGYPCQPFSTAGKRLGTQDERHLWPYVKQAISALGPRIVVLENVRGHLTLGFDVVLGEISELGYDARWGVVRASDTGAPHKRERLFIIAYPKSAEWRTSESKYLCETEGKTTKFREHFSVTSHTSSEGRTRRSTIPGSMDTQAESIGHSTEMGGESLSRWGSYGPAIRRWENITRPAPNPTIDGSNKRQRLNPEFVEWMMGLPMGWVTSRGLTASQELKMLGNGVVPQQALLALQMLHADELIERDVK